MENIAPKTMRALYSKAVIHGLLMGFLCLMLGLHSKIHAVPPVVLYGGWNGELIPSVLAGCKRFLLEFNSTYCNNDPLSSSYCLSDPKFGYWFNNARYVTAGDGYTCEYKAESRPPHHAASPDYRSPGVVQCSAPLLFDPLSEDCDCGFGKKWISALNLCVAVKDKYYSPPPNICQPYSGNPIYPLTGAKREDIILGVGLSNFNFSLHYDSSRALQTIPEKSKPGKVVAYGSFGKWWWGHRRLILSPTNKVIQALRGNAQPLSFSLENNAWKQNEQTHDSLLRLSDGDYDYRDQTSRAIEKYNGADGTLKAIFYASGAVLNATTSISSTPVNLAPEAGHTLGIIDSFGRTIGFTYTKISHDVLTEAITDAANQLIGLKYDSRGRLIKITWQDGTSRAFLYESPHPGQHWALTGIVDESSKIFATFAYDEAGWAKSTEHAAGVNRHEISYEVAPTPVVREELDVPALTLTRHHEWLVPAGTAIQKSNGGASVGLNATAVLGQAGQSMQGSPRATGYSQSAGAGCAASTSNITYDNHGNVASQDDFNGKRVCYGYEAGRNFESVRIEGLQGGISGTSCSVALSASDVTTLAPEARKITTEWHPDWKLETRRAEPGQIITWVYNGQPDPFNGGAVASCTSPMYGATSVAPLPDGKPIAVLCKQVVQSTADATGSLGFGATLQTVDPSTPWQVVSRTVSYTYNQYGQVLTSTDERGQVTNYAYYTATTGTYTKGDLWKVTNALGHITEYTQYNPHGQVLQAKDPNGVITSYTYDLRQRLTSVTQAGQLTQIDWWPTGLLKKVTQPDGSWLTYAYDDAHRLTDIADNLGNSVHYELDNAGNRKQELVKDSSGALTLQIDRNYDALNRLWKTSTGVPM